MPTATAPTAGFTGRKVTDSDPHGTLWIDGHMVPSVTRILPSPDLARAAAHVTATEAVHNITNILEQLLEDGMSRRQTANQLASHHRELWDSKAQLGTDVHRWALEECWQDPERITAAPYHVQAHLANWNDWVADTAISPILVEQTVYSRRYSYGGIADAWAVLDGTPVLLDVKTGRTVPDTAALQLAAYQWADFRLDDGVEVPLPPAERFFVVHLTTDKCELIQLNVTVHEWDAFRAARDLHRWMEGRK